MKPEQSKTAQQLENSLDDEIRDNVSKKGFKAWFEKAAAAITKAAGSSTAFLIASAAILIWAVTGPVFHFSNTWQLVINTGTTIITFLMVFLIQQSQNKDSMAIQLKLNELIACEERASNRLIVVEDLTQEELETLKNYYIRLSELAKNSNDLHSSHSVDEADDVAQYKRDCRHKRKQQAKAQAEQQNQKTN